MIRHLKKTVVCALCFVLFFVPGTVARASEVVTWRDVPSLKEVYADYFLIGNISSPNTSIRGELNEYFTEMFKYHFNAVTGENHFKPDSYSSSKGGVYDFTNKDSTMEWARENGIQVIGHTLAWHSQSAPWLNAEGLSREEARENLEEFIGKVAGHFEGLFDADSPNNAGNMVAWDVLNEAHLERTTNWRLNLRTDKDGNNSSPWYAAYQNGADVEAGESGADYIYDAFLFARRYAPSSVLYYNDFNDDNRNKSTAIVNMVNELNAAWANDTVNNPEAGDFSGDDAEVVYEYLSLGGRLLIEGIGMQSHYSTNVNVANVRASLERFKTTGAEISITELDVGIHSSHEDNEDEIQALVYAELFALYKEYRDVIERVTFWGVRDNLSWRSESNPLIFTGEENDFIVKEAFYAVLDPEGYLERHRAAEEVVLGDGDEAGEVVDDIVSEELFIEVFEDDNIDNRPEGRIFIILGVIFIVGAGVGVMFYWIKGRGGK